MQRETHSVLMVDDDPSNLLALEAILEPLGLHLVRAVSGEEALRRVSKAEFAVILLDVQMPGMDGFECAELLRCRPRTRDVPIVFLTAISKDRRFVRCGYGVGAVDYLFKPYDPDVLRSKVAVFVELARRNAIIRAQHETMRLMSEREIAEVRRAGEQRYARLADAMPLIVWTADADGALEYANLRFRELAPESEMDFASVVHPEDFGRFVEGWRGAVESGREWEAELRFGNPIAGFRVHLVRAVPWRDAEGRVAHWVGTSTDIDARVRAERAVRMLGDASRRLAAAFEGPSELEAVLHAALPMLGEAAILEVGEGDERRRVSVTKDGFDAALLDDPRLDVGPSMVRYTQRSEVRLCPPEAAPCSRGGGARLLRELGVAAHLCVPLASRRSTVGTLTFVRVRRGSSFTEEEVAIAEDLARRIAVALENARLHETSERRRGELEEANRGKDVFLATLSHELRTPLNAIVGWTDMLRSGQLEERELPHAVETIDRNAHALSGLVADLLDVSRIVTGTLKLDSRLFGVAAIVDAAVEAARPQCAAKKITLDLGIERVGCVRGDAGRLRQVFGNLLSNAIKFTPTGGRIAVRVERDGERARVVVLDDGEGIPPEFLPHVFDRFRQAESAKARGLGLGLAIVKHLVEQHGGGVTASSDGVGKGAAFTVELPIAGEEAFAEEELPSKPSLPAAAPALAGVSVLVVEDDPDGNELITTILERYGASVRAVGTAAAALDALDISVPDLLVSDIGLPDMDGLELVRAVRGRIASRALPAIALTAYASRQDAAKAFAAGFDAHVAKPVQPAVLGNAVAKLLARRGETLRRPPAA